MHDNGRGVPQDFQQAVKWYTKAAEQGDASAQSNLGLSYFNGQGVPQDYKQAVTWFTKAAEQGHASAQINLGAMYGAGQGVQRDYKQAYVWFSVSAVDGRSDAIKNRDVAQSLLTAAELRDAQRMASELARQIELNKAKN